MTQRKHDRTVRSIARGLSRRQFMKAAGAALAAPWVLPSTVFGAAAPSNRITFGCIGVGRMGTDDMRELLGNDGVRILAVCDVDSHRADHAAALVDTRYAPAAGQGCAKYRDFRELIARADIDAVTVVTPDHWHALPAIAAARAGKDIFIQKPMTLTIPEGRALCQAVHRAGVILQVGSQQRSDTRFRFACELVRSGRIGKLHTVKVAFAPDTFTTPKPPTAPPEWLDYDLWLGPAPAVPYIEDRVHPREGYGRPGWLRTDDYCCGMITGWGSHHMDIAHWGMGAELTGPTEVQAQAEYAPEGPWDVHGRFRIDYTYAGGVKVICTDTAKNQSGVRFEGTDGWVHVDRGFIDAGPRSLLLSGIGPDDPLGGPKGVRLYRSVSHKGNLLECIRTRREPIAPVDIGHRSASACIVGYIAMRLGRRLQWDPAAERFVGDDEASAMLARPMREPWRI